MTWPPTNSAARKAHERASVDEHGCVDWLIFPEQRDEVRRPPVVGQTWWESGVLCHDAEPEAFRGECFAVLRGDQCADLVAVES